MIFASIKGSRRKAMVAVFQKYELSNSTKDPSLHGLCGRNLYQLLVSPLVVLGYSLVEFWALMELAVRGREVCSHKPSNKTEL